MKHIARFLLLVMILSLCISMVGCTGLFKPKWFAICPSFHVSIKTAKGEDGLDFEIANRYYLEFTPIVGKVDEESYDQISIEFNSENMAISAPRKKHTYVKSKSKTIKYDLYAYEFAQDDTLKITYNGETIEINYDVIDYNFEESNWITPTSIEDLNKYPEFKEMLLSIKRHEFVAPYKGLESYSYSPYWDDGSWYYDLKDKNDIGYLDSLIDSVYYPSVFPAKFASVTMNFTGKENVMAGADRSVMDWFGIDYSIDDPHCNKPDKPFGSMHFSARNRELFYVTLHGNDEKYPATPTIWLEKYPERFFEYELNGLKLYVFIRNNGGVQAYFTDDNYFYSLSAGYDFN